MSNSTEYNKTWRKNLRSKGRCPQCGHHLKINSKTGKYYWRCEKCRKYDTLLHQGYTMKEIKLLFSGGKL